MNNEFDIKAFSPKQLELLTWWKQDEKDILIADGAIRSGKTISMICSFLVWSQKTFRNKNFIIAGQSINSLEKNVINPLMEILLSLNLKYVYNRSKNYLIIGTNIYYMYGASNELSYKALQGLTAAGALADEVALFPQSFTEQMTSRCSVEGSRIFFNCNPAGPYHYFKTEYIDKAEEKNIYHLHFVMDDNLTLAKRTRERYEKQYSGVFYKRYILGLWVVAEGIIFDMFSEDKHCVDTRDLKLSKYYVSCDYGVYNAFTLGLFGYELKKNKWYMTDEYYYSGKDELKQKDNEEYYNILEKFIGNRNIIGIIIDPSASSFIATIKKRSKYNIIKAKNDVHEGIENTCSALNENIINFDYKCKNMIREFYSYSWDEKAILRGEEKPIKQNDHMCDLLRYMINTIIYNKKILGWK